MKAMKGEMEMTGFFESIKDLTTHEEREKSAIMKARKEKIDQFQNKVSPMLPEFCKKMKELRAKRINLRRRDKKPMVAYEFTQGLGVSAHIYRVTENNIYDISGELIGSEKDPLSVDEIKTNLRLALEEAAKRNNKRWF